MRRFIRFGFVLALVLTVLTPVQAQTGLVTTTNTVASLETRTLLTENALVPTLTAIQQRGYDSALSWTEVTGAVAYSVYEGETPVLLGETTSLTYLDSDLTIDSVNVYRVAAITEVEGARVTGDLSDPVTVTIVSESDIKAPYLTHLAYTGSAIELEWIGDWKAESYTIYRSVRNQFSYTAVATVSDVSTYTDSTVLAETAYQYQIKANKIGLSGETITVAGDIAEAYTFLNADLPTFSISSGTSGMSAKVKVDTPNAYFLYYYYSDNEFDQYHLYSSVSMTTGVDSIASINFGWGKNKYVSFRVAYRINNVFYMSDYTDPVFVETDLTIKNIQFRSGGSKIFVYWDAQNVTKGYEVFASSNGIDYVKVDKPSDSVQVWATGFTTGGKAYFKIRPVYYDQTGPFTTVETTVLPPTQYLSASYLNKTSIAFSWTDVPNTIFEPTRFNNDGYLLYRTVDGTNYTLVAEYGKDVTSSVLTIDPNLYASYRLLAYSDLDGVRYFSEVQDPVTPVLQRPVISYGNPSPTTITFGWSSVPGADGYLVTRYIDGKVDSLITVSDQKTLIYTDKNISSQEYYNYTVVAYYLVNGTKVLSPEAATGWLYSALNFQIQNLNAVQKTNTSIFLSWDPVPGATGYYVYRIVPGSVSGAKDFGSIATPYLTDTVTFHVGYQYYVRAYTTINSVKYSGITTTVDAFTRLMEPKITATQLSTTSFKLSWNAIAGATGYYVLVNNGRTVTTVATTTALSTTITRPQGSNDLVMVIAYISTVTNPANSLPINGIRLSATLMAPANFKATSNFDTISFSYGAVTGATGYQIYASTDDFLTQTLVYSGTSLTPVLEDMDTGVTYRFKIRATSNSGSTLGNFSSPISVTPTLLTPKVTSTILDASNFRLDWAAIAGADSYTIYLKNRQSGFYEPIAISQTPTYTASDRQMGVPYDYRIRANHKQSNGQQISDYGLLSVTLTPLAPTNASVSSIDYTSISLSFVPNDAATATEIFRSSTLTGTYVKIATVTDSVYVNSGLTFNSTYFYKLRSTITVDGVTTTGNFTAPFSAKTALKVTASAAVSASTYNSVKLSWTAVSGASGYEIHRSIGTSTTFGLLTSTTATSYTNVSLLTNTKYNYKIRAYRMVGYTRIYGPFSTVITDIPSLLTPTATVTSVNNTTLKVSWPTITGANGYEVSYSTSENGTYTKLALVTTTSASISKLLTNTTYYVKVRAYRIVNYVKVYGTLSNVVTGKPIPATPVVTAVSGGVGKAVVSWAAITGASGYEVYLKTPESLDYVLAADTTTLTATLTSLQTGTVQSVKVLAYQIVNSVRVYSEESAVKTVTPIPSTVTGFKLAMPSVTSLKLSWSAVDGATGYEIFKSTSATGTFVSIGTVGQVTDFTVTGLTFNTTTYYKIQASTMVGDAKVVGLMTTALTAKTIPSTVALKVVNTAYNANALSWEAIEGASGYEIYVSTGTSTYYTLLKTQSTTTFNHTALVFNAQYNYKVRAYKLAGTTKIFGAFSTLTSVKTAVTAPSVIVSSTHDSIGLTWNAVTGANGYEVSIATALSGPYTVITQTAVSKTYSGLTTGTTYYVKIRSYRLVSTTKVYGQYATTITVTPSLAIPALSLNSQTDTTATFAWSAVAGATDYEVRIKSDAVDAQWVIESVSELTVTFSDLDPLAHYVAEIRAVKKVGEVSYTSEYSTDLAFFYTETR